MDIRKIYRWAAARGWHMRAGFSCEASIPGLFHGLLKAVFDALEIRMEVKSAPVFERHFQLHHRE
jgi:hypothetical protein